MLPAYQSWQILVYKNFSFQSVYFTRPTLSYGGNAQNTREKINISRNAIHEADRKLHPYKP
jgi:hypothetical protein